MYNCRMLVTQNIAFLQLDFKLYCLLIKFQFTCESLAFNYFYWRLFQREGGIGTNRKGWVQGTSKSLKIERAKEISIPRVFHQTRPDWPNYACGQLALIVLYTLCPDTTKLRCLKKWADRYQTWIRLILAIRPAISVAKITHCIRRGVY